MTFGPWCSVSKQTNRIGDYNSASSKADGLLRGWESYKYKLY